jgi:hypothetical protein
MHRWTNAELYRLYDALEWRVVRAFSHNAPDAFALWLASERVMTLLRQRGNPCPSSPPP